MLKAAIDTLELENTQTHTHLVGHWFCVFKTTITMDGDKERKYEVDKVFGKLSLEDQVQAPIVKVMKVINAMVDGPSAWFRGMSFSDCSFRILIHWNAANVVEKYRGPSYPYYHRKFKKVPTVDECFTDDFVCVYEANEQYKRERLA